MKNMCPAFQVIGTDTWAYRSDNYEFLLTSRSNHIGLSRTISEQNGDCS